MPLYFAYGANMGLSAMAARCPGSAPIGVGRLHRHRFLVMREGYASVARDPGSTVWGLVWNLALADVPALDRYEGVSGRLYTKAHQPIAMTHGIKRALIYLGRSSAAGAPQPGYLEAVIEAAQAAALPPAYVAELRGWMRGGRR